MRCRKAGGIERRNQICLRHHSNQPPVGVDDRKVVELDGRHLGNKISKRRIFDRSVGRCGHDLADDFGLSEWLLVVRRKKSCSNLLWVP